MTTDVERRRKTCFRQYTDGAITFVEMVNWMVGNITPTEQIEHDEYHKAVAIALPLTTNIKVTYSGEKVSQYITIKEGSLKGLLTPAISTSIWANLVDEENETYPICFSFRDHLGKTMLIEAI